MSHRFVTIDLYSTSTLYRKDLGIRIHSDVQEADRLAEIIKKLSLWIDVVGEKTQTLGWGIAHVGVEIEDVFRFNDGEANITVSLEITPSEHEAFILEADFVRPLSDYLDGLARDSIV